MILVISDTHSVYEAVNDQIMYAENELGVEISSVLHLGDFGVFRPDLRRFFLKEKQRFIRPVRFIEGNHEDFDILPWMNSKYGNFVTHLKRGSIHALNDYQFLAIGGAGYMDSMITRRAAIISDHDIDHCLGIVPGSIDIIISHDCPVGIGVPNTKGLEYYGSTGFKRSDEILKHLEPKMWLFGHHHKWFELQTETTRFLGLPSAWVGFGLLDSDYQFQFVKHEIPLMKKVSALDKFLKKFKLSRPYQ